MTRPARVLPLFRETVLRRPVSFTTEPLIYGKVPSRLAHPFCSGAGAGFLVLAGSRVQEAAARQGSGFRCWQQAAVARSCAQHACAPACMYALALIIERQC